MQGPGLYEMSGVAWSGHGTIRQVDVSADGGQTLGAGGAYRARAVEVTDALSIAWHWNGAPTVLMSRATDDTGAVQPTRAALMARAWRNYLSLQRHPELAGERAGEIDNVYA